MTSTSKKGRTMKPSCFLISSYLILISLKSSASFQWNLSSTDNSSRSSAASSSSYDSDAQIPLSPATLASDEYKRMMYEAQRNYGNDKNAQEMVLLREARARIQRIEQEIDADFKRQKAVNKRSAAFVRQICNQIALEVRAENAAAREEEKRKSFQAYQAKVAKKQAELDETAKKQAEERKIMLAKYRQRKINFQNE